ncbi:hypothetical protein EDB92DRAFT_1817662 [Lactarius akahatsu]|uniref:Uncharacterized protein n=1 Tax=Lactarius akahatsu TaxID=416441 RepID=A0AAD4LBZ7_9AGAM|nr:hypothetical protein EDB92DRAFT_1817662 [Lactarius akahatsu]
MKPHTPVTTMGQPLYHTGVIVNTEAAPLLAVHLQYLGGSAHTAPHSYKHNRGDDFIHYPITDTQGVTHQATFIQVVRGLDPLILGLVDDSNKVYSCLLYAEPQVQEAGKPHYSPEDMLHLVSSHSNQHWVDRVVNKLKDVGVKAELTCYRTYKHEAERMEQRLHTLAQVLGGVQGELTQCKFWLEMANVLGQDYGEAGSMGRRYWPHSAPRVSQLKRGDVTIGETDSYYTDMTM